MLIFKIINVIKYLNSSRMNKKYLRCATALKTDTCSRTLTPFKGGFGGGVGGGGGTCLDFLLIPLPDLRSFKSSTNSCAGTL